MRLENYIQRQKDWSVETFGPGDRAEGIVDHIQKELLEVEENPKALEEWCDIVILALDGAWRAGYMPHQVTKALKEKQEKNIQREWPDWRKATPGKAIEHIRH